MKTAQRLYWLDALRGVAALVIVAFHYHHFFLTDALSRPSIPAETTFPYGSILWPVFGPYAANAVELFWLISGYVFAHVYLARPTTGWEFTVARFARLYPLHFITLLYVAVLQVVSLGIVGHWQIYSNNDARHFALQLLFSSNWPTLSRGLSFNGPIWSVSVEIAVYAIFFFSLFAMRFRPLLTSIVLCVLCWAWFITDPVRLPLARPVIFECAGYFFLGSALCTLGVHTARAKALVLAVLGAAVCALGVVLAIELMAVAGASVALLTVAAGLTVFAPKPGKILCTLGDISYSVYLVHVPLQMSVLLIADLLFDGTRSFADSYLTLPLYLLASMAVAYVAYHQLERPVGKALRTRLLG